MSQQETPFCSAHPETLSTPPALPLPIITWGRGEATPRLGSHKPWVSVFIPTAMDKYMTQGSLGRKGLFWLVVQESHSIVAGKKWQQREGPSGRRGGRRQLVTWHLQSRDRER